MKIYFPLLALFLIAVNAPALNAAVKNSDKNAPPLLSIPPVTAPAEKQLTAGEYVDGAGNKHAWNITNGHMLRWEGAAYLPVGGAFTPHYWTEGQTEENWDKDVKALTAIRAQHVHDLYLYAGAKGLTHVPAEAAQRVIDYLDKNEFRYGIAIADPSPAPLMGYVVRPSVYRDANPGAAATFSHVDGLISATYVLATAKTGEILETGKAKTLDGSTAVATVKQPGDDSVLLLYPERLYADGTPESRMPDLWQGYDDYRDRLLAYFGHIKLGPNFRFFLDPLTDQLGVNGDADSIVPTSDGFRLEFQAWLLTKHNRNVNDVNQAWGLKDRDIPDYVTAARCIPLWRQTKGVAALFDPVDGKTYEVLNRPKINNGFWDDLTQFRTETLRRYMNSIATVLKTSVANVPVVYRAPKFDALFAAGMVDGGYDGLGIEAFGHGRALADQNALYTFAQAEDMPKTTWLIVSDTFGVDTPAVQKTAGYDSKGSLFDDWDYLKEAGARGFFTTALQRLPEDTYANANLAALPDQLGWLGSYSATLQDLGDMREKQPDSILWYPASETQISARPRHFADGLWWLPTLRPGSGFSMGVETVIQTYQIPNDEGRLPTWALWTGQNEVREFHFPFSQSIAPTVTDAHGVPIKIKGKAGDWAIPLGAEPVLVAKVGGVPQPPEMVDEAAAEVARLIKVAKAQHVATQGFEDAQFYANNSPSKGGSEDIRYTMLTNLITQLTDTLKPYAWLEGETAADFTFDSLIPSRQASAGSYLSLDTDRDPQNTLDADGVYHATYRFGVNAPGRYTIWLAGSPLDSNTTSPFSYSVDGEGEQETHDIPAEGPSYGGGFVWTNIGDVTLDSKKHALTIRVTGKAKGVNRYRLDIDALCLSRVEFHPNGLTPPPIDLTTPPAAPADNAKR